MAFNSLYLEFYFQNCSIFINFVILSSSVIATRLNSHSSLHTQKPHIFLYKASSNRPTAVMLTGRDVRILRWVLISLCLTGSIALITYATRAAYDEMYSSLRPQNGTSFATSPEYSRKMGSVPATVVIDSRSLKKHKLTPKMITYISTFGFIMFLCFGTAVYYRWVRILDWLRSWRPRAPAPSPVLINLEDMANKIKRGRRRSAPVLSVYEDGQQPDPCLPHGEEQIGEVSRAIPPAFMIRELTLPTAVRPSSDSAKSAPAALPTQEIPIAYADFNPPRTPSTTPSNVPTELTLELTRNPTPPNSEAMSTRSLPNLRAARARTPESDGVSTLTRPNSETLSNFRLPDAESVSSLARTSLENTDNPAQPALETPDSPTLPTMGMAESRSVEEGPA
ncbi:hypothetical protein GGI42DRAFT_322407 [Trichoderma sp. SZMC 28013]